MSASGGGGAPIDPENHGEIRALHSGHVLLLLIHSATQSRWNTWRHSGNSLHSSPRRSRSRQIAHSTDNDALALPPPRGAYGKCGSCCCAATTSGAGG
ncbi:Os06g0257850 [Oryza sativa Japonica Group]|uniref:Os06g0257850 protein n=1 Tax=Oryza sativa subsp. japonica TaxID=39947 RepID=A0A0P0WV23_ORYSJ|nr:Os06g0257850 [Oryza sativa Japonica Group]